MKKKLSGYSTQLEFCVGVGSRWREKSPMIQDVIGDLHGDASSFGVTGREE